MGEWLELPDGNVARRDLVSMVIKGTDTLPSTPVHYINIRVDAITVSWFSSTNQAARDAEFSRFLAEEV